jgi:hypothetical protein
MKKGGSFCGSAPIVSYSTRADKNVRAALFIL